MVFSTACLKRLDWPPSQFELAATRMYKKVSYNNNESSSWMIDAFIKSRAGLCRWLCLATACLCCLLPLQLRADNFIITHAQTGPQESTVVLDAGLRIDFAEEVLEIEVAPNTSVVRL